MKKIYYLSTCTTCKRIIEELGGLSGFQYQDIKYEHISELQIDEMQKIAGSYEALFSKRSRKYRAWNLHERSLTESDYRAFILQEYSFLKRPVIIIGDQIFIGNAKKIVEAAKESISL